MRLGPRPVNRPWTPEEDAQLLALLELKMERPLIARKLKRTDVAINIRLKVLKEKAKWTERRLIDPTPELPDDTAIENVQLPTRIRNALAVAGLKTVGEVREASGEMLLSLPDLGQGSVTHLRETLGLPSSDGVRPR
jgi:DNA-directed RNA polymerase alpha subunit